MTYRRPLTPVHRIERLRIAATRIDHSILGELRLPACAHISEVYGNFNFTRFTRFPTTPRIFPTSMRAANSTYIRYISFQDARSKRNSVSQRSSSLWKRAVCARSRHSVSTGRHGNGLKGETDRYTLCVPVYATVVTLMTSHALVKHVHKLSFDNEHYVRKREAGSERN